MKDVINFLWERQKDKRKFSFQYVNKQGVHKTHYPEGIKYFTENDERVELRFPNGSYTYTMNKMYDLRLIKDIPNSLNHNKQIIENLAVEDYFSKLVEKLIDENDNRLRDATAINYSLNKIKIMLNNQEQKKMNKVLFKKYMGQIKAKKINNEDQLIILPFVSNSSQKKAIQNALAYDVSVIQGPPGTGKTQTILNIIGNYIFQNKSVCVVSKNNSAVDNVIEKFEKNLQLYDFSIRMGNSKEYIPKLMQNYKKKIRNSMEQIKVSNYQIHEQPIRDLYNEIQSLEEKYEVLVQKRNLLYELISQKRHIDRKIKLYANNENTVQVNRFFLSPKILKREIEYLKYRKNNNGDVNNNLFFKAYTRFRFIGGQIDTSIYTLYQWRLEQLYAEKIIMQLQKETSSIESLESIIEIKYKEYNNISIDIINKRISEMFYKNRDLAKTLLEKNNDTEFFEIKNELIKLYPITVTSLDSICSNIGYHKFDLVIVDETSQADIITCLPALNISKQIVFVGDTKQLSHIVDSKLKSYDLELMKKYDINKEYCYSNMNALDSVIGVFNPPIQLLKEHYRCDYNIINFCNKMYYNNELIIYSKSSNPSSMQIMALDREKNSGYGSRKNGGSSYFNRIEEKAIVKYIGGHYDNVSIITPYTLQMENIEASLPELMGNIGTIYKFQGRENKCVFVSTVLTHEKDHCESVGAINDETINVAVSRAEEKFVLFTHKKFFMEIDHNLKHLISYIETYGKKLESNVNSIFSYLYKQIPYIRLDACYDSLWEKKVHEVLSNILKDYDGFYVVMKTSLADVITDEIYLENHPEFKTFALNRMTHIDFLIFTDLTDQPVLAIEVDGKYHENKVQKERDMKKDKILRDHSIPIWRLKSTDAIEEKDVKERLEYQINMFKEDILKFLDANKWKS